LCRSGEGRAVQWEGDSCHIHRSRDFVGIALVLERIGQQVVDIVLDKLAEVVADGRRVVVPEVVVAQDKHQGYTVPEDKGREVHQTCLLISLFERIVKMFNLSLGSTRVYTFEPRLKRIERKFR